MTFASTFVHDGARVVSVFEGGEDCTACKMAVSWECTFAVGSSAGIDTSSANIE